MRGTKAKRLRKADPMRPNPGRKFGGLTKMNVRHQATKPSMRRLKRFIGRKNKNG